MTARATRRRFLQSALAGASVLGLSDLGFLTRLGPLSAEEVKMDPKLVRLDPDIEPLVQLIEQTHRDHLLEEMAVRIRKGLSYREVLAALFLAGVRNVQPRPNVGFKFHAVLVVNSAHLASQAAPDGERWLPIFWALDYFKDSQAATMRESGWRMRPVNEPKVPPARQARRQFIEAMENWDEEAADAAVAGLARTASPGDVFELFTRFGSRDFRSIGHKAIFVANSWRTLQCIGWQHAEPILRSLAYALLMHEGGGNPAREDREPDRPGRRNKELAARIRDDWQTGELSREATVDFLATLRQASPDEACDKVVEAINRGVSPQSIWDALLLGAAELLMRQPGIVALHAVTSTNALYYLAHNRVNGQDETTRWLLLQNVAFLPLFREAMKRRGNVGDGRIDTLEPLGPGHSVGEIFKDVGRDRLAAARKALAFLQEKKHPDELMDAARLLVFLKGNDSHDYKFSSALLEDYHHASPAWRDRYLAAGTYQLRGSSGEDNPLVARTRAAMG